MSRAHYLFARLIRWTSLCVSFALVLSCLAIVPFASVTGKSRSRRYRTARDSERVNHSRDASTNQGQGNGNSQERRVTPPTPLAGPPPGTVPNLDDLRRATDEERRHGRKAVRAPDPIPSRLRRWRHGRERAEIKGQSSEVSIAKEEAPRSSARSSALSAVRAHHARSRIATVNEGARADRMSALPALALPPQGTSDMAMARIDPRNRTGTGGVDPLSNNFNWILNLLSLRGRGLDLGLTLSYNSLPVWMVSGNSVAFDMDEGNPSPGFQLGFPKVQGLTTTIWRALISTS